MSKPVTGAAYRRPIIQGDMIMIKTLIEKIIEFCKNHKRLAAAILVGIIGLLVIIKFFAEQIKQILVVLAIIWVLAHDFAPRSRQRKSTA
jgi:predicted branched-subunit amino acid permease